jgi:Big-like domain-containing protein
MSPQYRRIVAVAAATVLILLPGLAVAVEARFDLSSPTSSPFPSDRFTVDDHDQKTGLRVNLPKPDCAVQVSDCQDINVINTLDGFNLQPRLSIPFSGPIDVSTVSSRTVFLVRLGHRHGHNGDPVGINQVVWDVATNTLHAESDELLDQHTRYLLVVTDGVRDLEGHRVKGKALEDFVNGEKHGHDFGGLRGYREDLREALEKVEIRGSHVVAASLFSTLSATAVLEKIRHKIKDSLPTPAAMLGTFPLADITAIQWRRHTGTNLTNPTQPVFTTSFLATPALNIIPGSISAIAFGSFTSPDWETPQRFIPPIGTRTGVPVSQGVNTLYFNLFIPAGFAPPGGWPVAIFGHGFTDSKHGAPFAVASMFASRGIATIAINVVGHGGGALGTLTIIPTAGSPVTIPDGGRGFDQNGDGTIDSTEGVNAAPPRGIIASRDGLRQTVADLMQLVRVIETGGIAGLSRTRIYYAGQSFGGIYGVKLLALEDSIRAGVPNVPGGAIIEIARLSPAFRGLVGFALFSRIPSLLNAGPLAPPAWGFNENIPLRNQPAVINTVPGAMAIQEVLDNTEWVSQSGNPVAYAPHLRKRPLHEIDPPPVIIQFAKGDQTVPNPTATAIFRAGDLTDRSTYFRNDLVRAAFPPMPGMLAAPANPHTFLTNIDPTRFPLGVIELALAAQAQIATFFESDGTVVIDPDGAGPFFEVPIAGPLPEVLNF